jgi:hypothetical protein
MRSTALFRLPVFCFFLMLILYSCVSPKKKNKEKVDSRFSSYIYAYTTGEVSVKSNIRIRFQEKLNIETEEGVAIDRDLFKFSPRVKGDIFLVDDQMLEFRPAELLKSGELYEVEFRLYEIMDVPKDLSIFKYQLKTIKQSFDVKIGNYSPYSNNNLIYNQLKGFVNTADIMTEEDLNTILTANQDGVKKSVSWEADAYTNRHVFSIDSVQRGEKDSELIVSWNGKHLGIDVEGTDTLMIPSLDNFSVMSVDVDQLPEQCVNIQFSDPVKADQNLVGIIELEGAGKLNYSILNNVVKVYPSVRLEGVKKLEVDMSIRNTYNFKMKEDYSLDVSFEELKPEIRLIGNGVILPESEGLIFPFEAVNLNAVDIRIVKIYENNILQFLQVNQLDGDYQINRVGRPVMKKKISLTGKALDYGQWNAFSVDLSDLVKKDTGAIYQVELSFRKQYSLYKCDGESSEDGKEDLDEENWEYQEEDEDTYWDYYYYPNGYEWKEQDNPCHISYYNSRRWVMRNVIASNLGIIAKAGSDNKMSIFVNDIRTTEPIVGAKLSIYNYQKQLLGSKSTNELGMAEVELTKNPFILVASYKNTSGYMRLDDGSSLSISKFDVSGERIQKGIKGFMYGERGVWRPGDTLFLTFMLEDNKKVLPENHPVTFELYNPQHQLVFREVRTKGLNGFFDFTIPTQSNALTGLWNANVTVGGSVFSKRIRIETIKPNRLKIKLDFGKEKLSVADKNIAADLELRWLHGAIARNLKARISVSLRNMHTSFEDYKDFVFNDPSKGFSPREEVIFDDKVNQLGQAKVKPDLGNQKDAPGMLKADFMIKAFEEGGDFSTDYFSIPYAPYETFIGIKVPKGDKQRGMLLTDSLHTIEVVSVDVNGNAVSAGNLTATVYKVRWKWWWDVSSDNYGSFNRNNYNEVVYEKNIATVNGKAQFQFKVDYPNWGRYLVKVEDNDGGHSTGRTVYVDWPGWAGRAQSDNPDGATVLSVTADKKKYNVGEMAEITIPSGGFGRALVSIENGSGVIDAWWVNPQENETKIEIEMTEKMCPNVYAHVTLLQPHAQTANDLPIRLYGIVPIFVEDPATRLNPVLEMANELAPEKEFSIKVSEKNNKKMTYTIAVVDEGLLDLTRFNTPDPWKSFYAREALGVKTWDLYDDVLGAYSGKLERLFAIGGGGDEPEKSEQKANRFKPVVMTLGPYELKGGSATHKIMMPRYVGSVRTMLIAGHDGAYGIAEKTTAVKNPLMVLATLPRVLGPGESVKLPVTVFAMDPKVKNVELKIKPNQYFEILGPAKKEIAFDQTGDQVITFDLKVKELLGVGTVNIEALSGSEKAFYDIELDIRIPNPPITKLIQRTVAAGESWETEYTPIGMQGTNSGILEVSSIPPVDFGRRLKYLLRYPYGCTEQTTSAVFPQLFLSNVMEVDAKMEIFISKNVRDGIKRLHSRQNSDGGFRYWPSSYSSNDWLSSYAGHFILEAEALGYTIPTGMKEKWIKYQSKAAKQWRKMDPNNYQYYYHDLAQAYRLYTLALAGSPELGAMNRMRESKSIAGVAQWRLAAAYVLAGKKEVAMEMVKELTDDVIEQASMNLSYGSPLRDRAMILETLALLGDQVRGSDLLLDIADQLSNNSWYSTQTTAYCLLAIAKYSGSSTVSKTLNIAYQIDDNKQETKNSELPIFQNQLEIKGLESGNVKVKNNGEGMIFARILLEGTPLAGNESAEESKLNLSVSYKSLNGTFIDVAKIEQGTDFLAEVKITNGGLYGYFSNMALTQIFPSGWEIINTRIAGMESAHEENRPNYRDIRDDRVYTHFNIPSNKTYTYIVSLNAAYLGRFYLPAVSCEAMYDNTIYARNAGKWVEVVKPGE